MDFEIHEKGASEQPGVGAFAFIARHKDFLSIATLPATPATQAEKVTIADAHTFTPPNGFRKMYVDQDNSNLDATGYGSKDNKGATVALNAFFPGSKKEFAAFLKENPELICLVPDADCGNGEYKQIGTKCSPAKIDVEWTYNSGQVGANDNRGFEFRIVAHQSGVLWYSGAVTEAS